MNEINLNLLLGLTENERLEAITVTQTNIRKLIGEQPHREQFADHTADAYPPYVRRVVTAITLILITAFFLISSMRLYSIGSHTFSQTIPHWLPRVVAGISLVIGSEAGALGFTLSAGVLAKTSGERNVFYGLAGASALLALIGNIEFTLGSRWTTAIYDQPFALLEALFPPVVVIGGALQIKRIWLDDIARVHANEQAYIEAVTRWQNIYDDPSLHERWKTSYMHALKQTIIAKNNRGTGQKARVELMSMLNGGHWRTLVERELQADNWTEAPIQGDAKSSHALPQQEATVVPVPLSVNGNGHTVPAN